MWEKQIQFKVDIANIIAIMGQSLYSRLETPVRELIQNSHDAIYRRRQTDISFRGRIDIHQDAEKGTLRFCDNGIGLTPQEAEDYLGTLGIGITGLLKGRGSDEAQAKVDGSDTGLIGQFGIGLFSAFMLADRMKVESRSTKDSDAFLWSAGAGTDIILKSSDRQDSGTTVELELKPEFLELATDEQLLERVIKEFADFIDIPIHLNGSDARVNLITAAWFEHTPDAENIELELASYFNEHPLDVVPIRREQPISVAGAVYISPQRTPGFADRASVSVTVRRMVISNHVTDLLPPWGDFFRGVLELHDCNPTASREDLVRDQKFEAVQKLLEEILYEHLEKLQEEKPALLKAIVETHRYSLAGAAHFHPRLRKLLRVCYPWPTSRGLLVFDEILKAGEADPLFEPDADTVVWYNADRRQERWMNNLFHEQQAICVHTTRSFEETLLAAMVSDVESQEVHLRMATLTAPNFGQSILGIQELDNVDETWQKFFDETGADIKIADMSSEQPAIAFLNERFELLQSIEDLKREGGIPLGFERLIDDHFREMPAGQNEVLLNRKHRLVRSVLEHSPSHPLASVLRIVVINVLNDAGAKVGSELQRQQRDDLNWIAEVLAQGKPT